MNNLLRHHEIAFIGAFVALLGALMFVGTTSTNALVTSTLSPGASGSQVSELQTFLATDATIYPEGLVTGYYGSLTTAAVQRLQCRESIVCSGSVGTTGYGRVGPITLARIQVLQGSVGGPVIGGDVSAPILSRPTVATTSTTASIHWTTNEPAFSRVMYATTWPFLFTAAASTADVSMDMSSDVTLTGLQPNTLYFFALQSADVSGNLQWGIGHSFRTNP
ncbi:hypothetical protein C4556_03355 [Candidatus Parcubacteria bacterium]|nr:MAG: hypothetical protein C4556_03355 [Candidatus Parcubacteria bacterium]